MGSIYYEDLSCEKPFQCYRQKYDNLSWNIGAHWHYYVEFVFVISGTIQVFLSGIYHKLTDGQFVFIDSQAVHAFQSDVEKNVDLLILKFDKRLMLGPSESYDPNFAYLLSEERRIIPDGFVFAEEKVNEIVYCIYNILRENEIRTFGYELAIRSYINSLFLWVLRQQEHDYQEKSQLLRRGSDSSMLQIQNLMIFAHYNFREDLNAEQAAKQCNMSYSYFSRKFKDVTGKTFSEYINLIRVQEAEKLLTTTSNSITEIALEVGFSNTSYFIKQFQKYRFTSPLQFRKKMRLN